MRAPGFTRIFHQSKFYSTLLYNFYFLFLSCISFFFLYFNCFYHKKNDAKILGCPLCALRTMLVSVVGVGIHWLDSTMRKWKKFSNCGSFGYST